MLTFRLKYRLKKTVNINLKKTVRKETVILSKQPRTETSYLLLSLIFHLFCFLITKRICSFFNFFLK